MKGHSPQLPVCWSRVKNSSQAFLNEYCPGQGRGRGSGRSVEPPLWSLPPAKANSPGRRSGKGRARGSRARSLGPLPSFPLLAQRPSLPRREAEPPARRPPIGSSSPKLPRVLLESAFHISCGLQKWPWAAGEGREEGKRWLAETSERGAETVYPSQRSVTRPAFRSGGDGRRFLA